MPGKHNQHFVHNYPTMNNCRGSDKLPNSEQHTFLSAFLTINLGNTSHYGSVIASSIASLMVLIFGCKPPHWFIATAHARAHIHKCMHTQTHTTNFCTHTNTHTHTRTYYIL